MSVRGFGAIRSNATPNTGGGGVTGANNGLDLDGANVVLGQDLGEAGDPAALLSDRQIPMAGFRLLINDGLNDFIDLDPVGQTAIIGASANNFLQMQTGINETLQYFQTAGLRAINLDFNSQFYGIGDIDFSSSGIQLDMDGSIPSFVMQSGTGGRALEFDQSTGTFLIGDIDGIANTTLIELSDAAQVFAVSTGGASSQFLALDMAAGLFRIGDIDGTAQQTFLAIDDPTTSLVFSSGGNSGLDLNIAAGIFQMGDLSGVSNSSVLDITDSQERLIFTTATNNYLTVDGINDLYFIGDINNLLGGMSLTLDGGAGLARLMIGGTDYMLLDVNNQRFGDVGIAGNGCVIDVNDPAGTIGFANAANNVNILINGNSGFNGTVTPVTTITVEGGIVTNVA